MAKASDPKLSYRAPEALKQKLKLRAAQDGRTVQGILDAALESYLAGPAAERSKPKRTSSGMHRRNNEVEDLLAYMEGPPDEEEDLIRGLVRVRAKNAARRGGGHPTKLHEHG